MVMKEEKTDSYNHVLKYTGLLGGVQVFYILLSVVRNKLTAIFIGEAGMGLADLYARTTELLANATNFGLGFSAVRRLSELYDERTHVTEEQTECVRTIRTCTLMAALLGAMVCLFLSPWLSRWVMGNAEHTLSFSLLSPMVAFATLTGGEMAVLKAMRQLKKVAANSALSALCTLLVAAPLYAWLGIKGVIPVLLLTSGIMWGLHFRAACETFSYRVSPFRYRTLSDGIPLIRLGLYYIAAGLFGSGAELLIRVSVVSSEGGLVVSGLYAAGLTLTVSYARLVFVAMDSDYFPRLSSVVSDSERMNRAVNRQIDVLVLLMAPFLILFALCLPIVVRLLYKESFLPVMPMVICALPYMFFKAVYSPIAYLSLASGSGRVYIIMELIYDVVLAVSVIAGYQMGGLTGAGLGLSLANLCDLVMLTLVYGRLYHFSFERSTFCRAAVHASLLLVGLLLAWQSCLWLRCAGGACVFMLSIAYSWRLLNKETVIVAKIKSLRGKFWKKK